MVLEYLTLLPQNRYSSAWKAVLVNSSKGWAVFVIFGYVKAVAVKSRFIIHRQHSSTINNHPRSSIHDLPSTIIHPRSSTIIHDHQQSSTIINHHQQFSSDSTPSNHHPTSQRVTQGRCANQSLTMNSFTVTTSNLLLLVLNGTLLLSI
jgi:hypothetical protein